MMTAAEGSMALASAGVSMSLADVDMTKVGKKEGSQYTMMGLVTLILVGGTIVLWMISFPFLDSSIAFVAGIYAILLTPYVLYQRYSLSKQATLRQVHNRLRNEVNHLSEENREMEAHVSDLEGKAARLERAESNLSAIVTKQGTSVTSFVDMVKENGKIQEDIEKLLMVEVMQNILTAVIRADQDMNFRISEDEINLLLLRLKSLPGVDFIDENEFKKMVQEGGNGINAIVDIVKNLERAANEKKVVRVSSRKLLF